MIETVNLTDSELADYNFMLLRALANRQHVSALAIRIWKTSSSNSASAALQKHWRVA